MSDGASVFVGRKSGVGAKFLELNKKIIVWHCLSHRLELSIADAKTSFPQFKLFQDVLNGIYKFYSKSSKNTNDIKLISDELDQTFIKIGKIFDVRWAASSYNTVCAVINNLEALIKHFSAKKNVSKDKDRTEKISFILENLRSMEFQKKSTNHSEGSKRVSITKLAITKKEFKPN